jgi:hypothetical protein
VWQIGTAACSSALILRKEMVSLWKVVGLQVFVFLEKVVSRQR